MYLYELTSTANAADGQASESAIEYQRDDMAPLGDVKAAQSVNQAFDELPESVSMPSEGKEQG